jgi:hypothetical protein
VRSIDFNVAGHDNRQARPEDATLCRDILSRLIPDSETAFDSALAGTIQGVDTSDPNMTFVTGTGKTQAGWSITVKRYTAIDYAKGETRWFDIRSEGPSQAGPGTRP